jgi:glycosyltransferase involved in cell wall biosynthesis
LTRIVLLVTSDIIADQRVHRTASTLIDAGYDTIVIGRRLKSTQKKITKPYYVKLLRLPFNKGPFFYATYNIYAFLYLIFKRIDLIHANDLDTLLTARLLGFFKCIPIIYDSHELFTEVPELIIRRRTQKTWIWLERRLVKGLQYCSTVSNGVANELFKRYKVQFQVIRNFPFKKNESIASIQTPENTIIYQGALNVGRGLEKLIEAMQWLNEVKLIVAGTGDIENKLKDQCENLGLNHRVSFLGRIPLDQLHKITSYATIGVSIEEDFGLNYRFALPNKLFDYIQAGLPVLTSNLPEMASIVNEFNVGETIESNCTPMMLADKLTQMMSNSEKMLEWQHNSLSAAKTLCWENESEKLLEMINNAIKNFKN